MHIDFPNRILDSLDSGIYILNIDLEILYWNNWMQLHTKKPSSEVIGKKITDLFEGIKTSSLKRKIKTALALNSPAFYASQTSKPLFEIQRPHISNTVFHQMKQDITLTPYSIELGLVCINIVDQTPLFEANYKLSTTADFKTEFLSNMSHEIRTPMNAILGFVEQLAKNEKDTSRQEQFKIIQRSGNALLTIINDILDLSKIESGEFELNLKTCDIKQTCEEITLLYTDLAIEKNITLNSSLDDNVPQYLNMDVMRTKQIIFNLLSNAIKFTQENGKVDINFTYEANTKNLVVSVTDNGIGIATENITKIFHAFKQEDSSTSEHFGGTGLGLAISSKLIKIMKGSISVDSTEGEGSNFYFSIPIYPSEKAPEVLESSDTIEKESIPLSSILVVEDNKTNQILMSMILDDLSQKYTIANNGLEALTLFETNSYDIILMDENMPIMSGEEATIKMRALELSTDTKATPIIAVTANALAEDKKRLNKAGMDDFIAKPYSEQDIKNILFKYLN